MDWVSRFMVASMFRRVFQVFPVWGLDPTTVGPGPWGLAGQSQLHRACLLAHETIPIPIPIINLPYRY